MADYKLAFGTLLLVAASACASASGPVTGSPPLHEPGIPIEIENSTTVSLRLYAQYAGGEVPLGRVAALAHRAARLPSSSGMIRLVARPAVDMGLNRSYRSEPVALLPGHRVTWRLQTSPGVSDLPRLSTIRVLACADDQRC